MATPRPWTVLPHGPIEKLTENVWTVDGALPDAPLRRRMTLVRLADGRLAVHNAVALSEGLMRDIEAWGEPAILIVPNGWHRLDAHAWKQRYPKSTVWCPKGAVKRVEQVVPVDGSYDLFPKLDGLSVEPLDGEREMAAEGVFTARDASGRAALIFNDTLFNHPDVDGFSGSVMKLMGSTGGPRVTRFFRLVGVNDKRRLAAQLRHRAAEPGLSHLVPGHGDPVAVDAPGVLRDIADSLAPA